MTTTTEKSALNGQVTLKAGIARLRLRIDGITPLVMSNIRMADPRNFYAVEIKKITDKGERMTDDDRDRKADLEWRGYLYESDGVVVLPVSHVRKTLHETAKSTREGTDLLRAVLFETLLEMPLVYDGSKSIEALGNDPRFRLTEVVNLNPSKGPRGGKGLRTRPVFKTWGVECDLMLQLDVMNLDNFCTLASKAGRMEGMGTRRALGNGRFDVQIEGLA